MNISLFKVATLLFTATGFLAASAPSEACDFDIRLRNKQETNINIYRARFKLKDSSWTSNKVSGNKDTIREDTAEKYSHIPGNCSKKGKFEIRWKCSGENSTNTLTTAYGTDRGDEDTNIFIKFCGCGEDDYEETWDTNNTSPSDPHDDCPDP